MNTTQIDTDENWLRCALSGVEMDAYAAQTAENWINTALHQYSDVTPGSLAQQDAASSAAEL